MIRPLRQRHRRIITFITVLLPVLLGIGVAARRPVPTNVSVAENIGLGSDTKPVKETEVPNLFETTPVKAALVYSTSEPARVALRVGSRGDFVKPDLIVYWLGGQDPIGDRIPEDALLLGAFDSGLLSLPDRATRESGVVILYSLADNEVVEVSRTLEIPVN